MKKGLYLILNVKLIAGLTASLFALVIIFTAFAAGKSVTAGNFNSTAKPIIIIDAGHGGEDGELSQLTASLKKILIFPFL